MKILLSGVPGIGKSVIIQNFIDNYHGEKYGIVIHRMRDAQGVNQGFEAINVNGEKKIVAHRSLVTSDTVVGNGHKVDIGAIDTFVVSEVQKGLTHPNATIVIDEIGRMQSYSHKFLQAVAQLIESDSNILATIVYDPEPWSLPFKENGQVILVGVTETNRDALPEVLLTIYTHIHQYQKLTTSQQLLVYSLTKSYFKQGKYIQIIKLFKNAIEYIAEQRVKESAKDTYEVIGNHDKHLVQIKNGNYQCDCDLFSGQGEYQNNAGECSHIQAVKILSA